jgi:hypothetical protein
MASLLRASVLALAVLASCATREDDPPAPIQPNALGSGKRVSDVRDPTREDHPASDSTVEVTGAVVVHIDTFDETKDGKSRGTVYVQDVNGREPYSGISLYSPSYIPADLKLAPGDVIDLRGKYSELKAVGTADFAGKILPQLDSPVATFRYETPPMEPVEIDPNDLNDYETGRKWLGMLVTVKNITIDKPFVPVGSDKKTPTGRVTAHITENIGRDAATVSNEFYGFSGDTPAGTHYESITGVVTWFFAYHIAPRSAADLK